MGTAITIGDAAAATGLTPKAIRLYESRGLVEPAERTAAGYRTFSEDALRRLRFIAASRRLGLHLDQVAEILDAADAGGRPCSITRELLDQRIGEVDRVVDELNRLRAVLLSARESEDAGSTDSSICHVIETGGTSNSAVTGDGGRDDEVNVRTSALCRMAAERGVELFGGA